MQTSKWKMTKQNSKMNSNKEDGKELEWLLKELIEISNVLASSILTLKGKK